MTAPGDSPATSSAAAATTMTTTTTTTTTARPSGPDTAALEADLLAGFWNDPPTLPARWFYDETGSRLFDRITRLPEYYQTRCEARILRDQAAGIVGDARTVVELGAGTAEKTRVLLDALTARERPRAWEGAAGAGAPGSEGVLYVPVDISVEMLHETARALTVEYPGLRVEPVVSDITALDEPLPGTPGSRLVLFLGGTIGNLTEAERTAFLAMILRVTSPGDRVALGFDLVKDPARLVAAYDDAAGVTAEFDLNMLDVICRTVECDGLDRQDFRHEAVWNGEQSRIEMWLRAVRDVDVTFPTLGRRLSLAAGQGIRTEIARKFTADELEAELGRNGLDGQGVWTDDDGDFGLLLAEVR